MRTSRLKPPGSFIGVGCAVVVIALVLAACSNGKADTSATTSTTRASTTTSAPSTAEQKVLADYHAFWDAYLAASNPMDPQNPVLAEHAAGGELEQLQKAFLALKSAGRVIRGQFDLAPRVVSIDGSAATVRDCYGDNTGTYDAATGARQDVASGKRHLAMATLRLDGGMWKVVQLADEGLGCTAA